MSFNQAGADKIRQENTRQLALEWWNKVPTTIMAKYAREMYPGSYAFSLSGAEIERMYLALNRTP